MSAVPETSGTVETPGFAVHWACTVGPVQTSVLGPLAAAVEAVLAPSRQNPDEPHPLVSHRGVVLTPESVLMALSSGDAVFEQMGVRPSLRLLLDIIGEVERRETARLAAGEPSAGESPPADATFTLEPESDGSDVWPPRGADTVNRPRRRGWLRP